MSLQFDGERRLSLPPEKLWPKLSDARFLIQSIPDATLVGEPTPQRGQCTVKPNLTFARGNLEVTVQVVEAQEPSLVKLTLASRGVGSSSDVQATVGLTPDGDGTTVRWSAEVLQLGGLLKMVPAGLIRGAAQKAIEDLWTGVERRVRLSETDA
jgi:carbon monoxide dehydrogenase subunit G